MYTHRATPFKTFMNNDLYLMDFPALAGLVALLWQDLSGGFCPLDLGGIIKVQISHHCAGMQDGTHRLHMTQSMREREREKRERV